MNNAAIIPFIRNFVPRHSILKFTSAAINPNASVSAQKEVKFTLPPFKLHRLDKGPETSVTLTAKDALDMYTNMVSIRRMENMCNELYKTKLIRGFLHLYTGQEAVATGLVTQIRKEDTVIGAYRIHGWAYLLGVSIHAIIAELMARKTGVQRGKGGSMHMYTKKFYGGNGIVGAQLSLGAGLALAHKLRNTGGISWTVYGDGSANQGQGAEAMNMCKLWDLPCIYVCENNHYAMGTKDERGAANTAYYTRGDLIPGVWADGMDILSCREAARFAVEHVMTTKGPIILELDTYRYFGHSMSDPGLSYRTREEVQQWRKTRDPINSLKERMISSEFATAAELKDIDAKVRKEVEAAAEQSKKDPFLDMSELAADVYAVCLDQDGTIRGLVPNANLTHTNLVAKQE